jgi:hypothetical protein
MLQVTFTDQELEQVAAMVAGDLDARCDTPVLRTAFLKLMQASTEAKYDSAHRLALQPDCKPRGIVESMSSHHEF